MRQGTFDFHELLPPPIDGETLYSWITRYARLSCIREVREIGRRLFGNPRAASRHDLPTHIDHMVDRIGPHLGQPTEVINDRTVLPYFRPFFSTDQFDKVIQSMRTGKPAHVRSLMGTSSSRMGIDSPLKACPACIRDDRMRLGFTVWYRRHQWPTTYVCLRHATPLRVVSNECLYRQNKLSVYPHELPDQFWSEASDLRDKDVNILHQLAHWTESLTSAVTGTFTAKSLRHTYAIGARALGYMAFDGSVRMQSLCDDLRDNYSGLDVIPSLEFIASAGGNSGGFVGAATRQSEGIPHPAKHLLLAMFLFDSWTRFAEANQYVSAALQEDRETDLIGIRMESRDDLLELIKLGRSVNAAAKIVGTPVSQAIRLLNQRGITYQRRPRIVGTKTETRLISLLSRGASRKEISGKLKVRPSFIKDYLAKHPSLKAQWQAASLSIERSKHRSQFLNALKENPGLPIKRIRRLQENGFQWLYNNDRGWLQEQLPAIWSRPKDE